MHRNSRSVTLLLLVIGTYNKVAINCSREDFRMTSHIIYSLVEIWTYTTNRFRHGRSATCHKELFNDKIRDEILFLKKRNITLVARWRTRAFGHRTSRRDFNTHLFYFCICNGNSKKTEACVLWDFFTNFGLCSTAARWNSVIWWTKRITKSNHRSFATEKWSR